MSRSNCALALMALCLCLALPGNVLAKRYSSRILVGEEVYGYIEPRHEKPPYSAVLDDAHYALVGLGENQDKRFELDLKSAQDVLAFFGPSPRTDFGENDSKLYCYLSSRPGDKTAVVFTVYPDSLSVVDVHADRSAIIQAKKRCRETPMVSTAVRTPGGLRLGMTREQALTMFGAPHKAVGRRHIEYSSMRPGRPGEFVGNSLCTDTWRNVEIYFGEDDRVNGFAILVNGCD
ncbi:hypothetical protein SAMN04488503_3121 [Humidesulfovibrio mexicanus]|uniref:Uncharacterized protein n=1 Tax=Humidesulfovibrio mexicanus TaxID=147047 RepID=A0A239CIS3_9BACT|nr:hypothetical protein SAMN04488503_3121 [Humidesulfovibrio mexicanus]